VFPALPKDFSTPKELVELASHICQQYIPRTLGLSDGL